MNANLISIVIADDHPLFRNGLRQALTAYKHIQIVSEAANGTQLCLAVEKHRPDVVITDLSMPVTDGREAIRRIKEEHPATGIVVLSMHGEAHIIAEMMKAGVHAYLLKTAEAAEIEKAVHQARQGKIFLGPSVHRCMAEVVQYACRDGALGEREKTILRLLFQQLTTKEIAGRLHVSERTVEDYRKNMLAKTSSKTIAGLIRYGLRNGIMGLDE